MLRHQTTIHVVNDLRREDLRRAAGREWRAAMARAHARNAGTTLGARWLVTLVALSLIVIGLVVAPGAFARATTGPAAQTSEEAANREVARRFFEELHGTGDLTVADEIIAPGAVFHIPGGEVSGPEGIGGLVTLLRAAFPDATFPMEDVVADEDVVAVRWVMHGTSQREFQGIPPTGEAVELRGTAFLRIENGRIVEDWVSYDQLGLLQQLGAVPEVAANRTCVAHSKAESYCR